MRTAAFQQPYVGSAFDGAVIVKVFDREHSVGLLQRDKDDGSVGVICEDFAEAFEEFAERDIRSQQRCRLPYKCPVSFLARSVRG